MRSNAITILGSTVAAAALLLAAFLTLGVS